MTVPFDPKIQFRPKAGGSDKEGSVSELFDYVFGTTVGLTPIRGATNWGGQLAGSGGSGASINDTFIVQTTAVDCPNSQALGSLATGILMSTTGTGVVSIVTIGTGLSLSGSTLTATGGSGGGTPGGTSGQIQYDNAGSFGGFTMSGDATLVAPTGAITVTKT